MGFTITTESIRDNQTVFIYEECAFSGVRKTAGWVRDDIEKVFGVKPIGVEYANFNDTAAFFSHPVFFGTVGNSDVLDALASEGRIDLFDVAKEREVYSFKIVNGLQFGGFEFESALIIAGSDKRGTIYGLLKLSELLGVSPFVNWLDVKPASKDRFTLLTEDSFVSRTPSVQYRGFFINDEWPAFGTWCERNFGGFNVKVYSLLFELLLRLKGNYMWPAMWTSVFYEDGPKEACAALADELGIVMGTSHHEPCLRQGEEYSHLRGKDSVYGDAWDFVSNRDGIIRFWEDGISQRCKYENIITLGMRGENDTKILKDDAPLSDNIELLRDVISTQNRIIADKTGKDPKDTKRLFALYKETEPFYYGDDTVQGLMDDQCLDGVTVLLCDDNHGNLRTLPSEKMLDHNGGFGMYYHFDYHGEPVSYEWFNTTYLPKVWEQMTMAYDNGVRTIWIVNVGDLFTNEYPLAFFLDLAYDFDIWGTSDKNSAGNYTAYFVSRNFPTLSENDRQMIQKLLLGYTRITSMRRTEAMNDSVYAPATYGESERMLSQIDDLMKNAAKLYETLDEDTAFVFYEIVYLPLTATLNVQKMWLLCGLNHYYASIGSTAANMFAHDIKDCIKKDRKLMEKLDTVRKGKWYGMGRSEHIGFTRWCAEECRYPVIHTVEPSDSPRLIVSNPVTGEYTEGGFWSGRTLTMPDALNPVVCGGYIYLSAASSKKVPVKVTTKDPFLEITKVPKNVKSEKLEKLFVFVDRMKISDDIDLAVGKIKISTPERDIEVRVPVNNTKDGKDAADNTFLYCSDEGSSFADHISMNAASFYERSNGTPCGSFEIIKGYGRGGDAVKVYPQNVTFTPGSSPYIKYAFILKQAGIYNVRMYTSPANPAYPGGNIMFGIAVGDGDTMYVNMLPDHYRVEDGEQPWMSSFLANVRVIDIPLKFEKGFNTLKISAVSLGFVLEKIVITPQENPIPYSYLGPPQSYCVSS
ncbi:MAG: glycosyl hydrolase 115 family protein [Lachnospiraceae bacterium]|nr:glycosyl hydrolase 115 family protein [Lachnospiraceae bacterium]